MHVWMMFRQDLGKESPDDVVFWVCAFALNQHRAADEVGSSPERGPFNAALAKARWGAVMVLDDSAHPSRRVWWYALDQSDHIVCITACMHVQYPAKCCNPARHSGMQCGQTSRNAMRPDIQECNAARYPTMQSGQTSTKANGYNPWPTVMATHTSSDLSGIIQTDSRGDHLVNVGLPSLLKVDHPLPPRPFFAYAHLHVAQQWGD